MADYDGGFKVAARHSGAGLSRLAGVAVDGWEAIGDTLQTTERLADRAFRGRHGGERFVVYMEAYTRWATSAPWSVLAKSGLLSERERLPCQSLIFVLLPAGYHEQGGTFQLAVEGQPTQQVWFREVCLWRERPEEWWEHHPGLMALYPLCDHRQPLADAVAHAAESIRYRHLDSASRGNLLTTLGIFGRLVDAALDAESIIGREFMRDSPLVQGFMHEAQQIERRQAIRDLLVARYGEERTRPLDDALNRITDLARLQELFRQVAQARRLTQVVRLLGGGE
jgi:hypothetical protein